MNVSCNCYIRPFIGTDLIKADTADIPGKIYLFFEEIQEVRDWEKCISSLRVSLDCDIYITGSNANLLSGELSTYLVGRYVEFIIYPFSFAEFLELYRTIAPDAPVRDCFQKFLVSGGMPYLANIRYEEAPSELYLRDLFNSVQLKDWRYIQFAILTVNLGDISK